MRYPAFLAAQRRLNTIMLAAAIGCGVLAAPATAQITGGDIGIRLSGVATGLAAPNWGIASPIDPNRLFVTDQPGIVWSIDLGTGERRVFLDIRDRIVAINPSGDERGLLGLAFHPDFGTNGLLYTYTSEPAGAAADFSTLPAGVDPDHHSVISEWRVANPADPGALPDASNRRVLLRIAQPQPNHNGGALAFGADGFLYIALGDGGGGGDQGIGHSPGGNGQDRANPLGDILRIDPLGHDAANGRYGIPTGNPFIGQAGLVQEIFAYGFRNPFRISFDSASGQLWAADVGQGAREEIDIVQSGGNYGWNRKEGTQIFDGAGGLPPGLIDPLAEYTHDDGSAIIGGFVYRGAAIPALQGRYVFGDFTGNAGGGRLFYLESDNHIREFVVQGAPHLGLALLGFAQDGRGELYALAKAFDTPFDGDGGVVLRLDPAPAAGASDVTGVWFDPARNGQGVQLLQNGGHLAGAWFVYDALGADTWFTFSQRSDGTNASAGLLSFTGPALGAPWDIGQVASTVAGNVSLNLQVANRVSFAYGVGASTDTLNLQPFDPHATGGSFTGVWWDPARNGQGLHFLHDGANLSGVWYHYGANGSSAWLSFTGPLQDSTLATDLLRFTGPALGQPWNPGLVQSTPAGTVNLRFYSPFLARFEYGVGTVNGSFLIAPFALSP